MLRQIILVCQLMAFIAVSANPLVPRAEVILPPLPPVPTQAGLVRRAASCFADNCARAVTGTSAVVKPALSSRSADCNSFFLYTVTPLLTVSVTAFTGTETDVSATTSTSLSTEIDTTTTTTTIPAPQKKRAAVTTAITYTPTSVPAYASPCSGTSRYSSACSCLGATSRTTTAPTSTVTVTVSTVTTTVTSTTSITTTTTTTTATATATYIPTSCAELSPSYSAPNGERFNTHCGQVYYGSAADYTGTYAPNFRSCIDSCAAANCAGVSYSSPIYSTNCFLYNTIQGGLAPSTIFDSGSPA